jgi:8-oxo-dGTP pyrophosphatase MutT (NUDIX family)
VTDDRDMDGAAPAVQGLPAPGPAALAATAVLLRDGDHGADGLEVLLLERPRDRGSFAGAWVFPGGRVDPEDLPSEGRGPDASPDLDDENAARRAAVREVREETGLTLPPAALLPVACWTPPEHAPRRFRTWFYLAAAPPGDIVLSEDEITDFAWFRPTAALLRHAAGRLSLVPPTWVTLHGLTEDRSVAEALARARTGGVQKYVSRIHTGASGPVLLWDGDVAYADDSLFDADGGRHRLEIGALPWVYSRSAGTPRVPFDGEFR